MQHVDCYAKSLQSCPTLCDPIDGSPPGSPVPGILQARHWSGLPFPSPMHESEEWKWSCSVLSDSSRPRGLQPTRLLRPWGFSGKSIGVGCHRLLCKSWLPGFIKLFSIHSHGNWLWIICVILNNDNRISTMILYSWCYCYISLAISFIKLQLFPNKKTTFYSGSFITKDKDASIFITLGLITLCILNNAFKVRV